MGAPLLLRMKADGQEGSAQELVLGSDLVGGERPQIVVPSGHWQSARSLGQFTLVGCTVAPGFEFSGFEMAPHGFEP
jgi:predicted cupin superfamily sugar epimerase